MEKVFLKVNLVNREEEYELYSTDEEYKLTYKGLKYLKEKIFGNKDLESIPYNYGY